MFMPFLRSFDSIEMRTNFCGQNRLGAVLFDNELIQVGDELFGFEIKIDIFLLAGRGLGLVDRTLLGQNHGRYNFNIIAEFFGQKLTDFFLQFLWIRYFLAL